MIKKNGDTSYNIRHNSDMWNIKLEWVVAYLGRDSVLLVITLTDFALLCSLAPFLPLLPTLFSTRSGEWPKGVVSSSRIGEVSIGTGAVVARLRIFLWGLVGWGGPAGRPYTFCCPGWDRGLLRGTLVVLGAAEEVEILEEEEELYTLDMEEVGWYSLVLTGDSDKDKVGDTGSDTGVRSHWSEDEGKGDEKDDERGIFAGHELGLALLCGSACSAAGVLTVGPSPTFRQSENAGVLESWGFHKGDWLSTLSLLTMELLPFIDTGVE